MIAAVAATLAIAALLLTIERRILGRRRLTAAHLDGYVRGVDEGVRQAGIQRGFDEGWHGQSRRAS